MKIVTLGGGTGQFTLLQSLRHLPNLEVTAIVSMADSGGSSGRLRDELGALPPGDILKALLALSSLPGNTARELLLHRFSKGTLRDHNAGNMLLTILSQYSGSFLDAVKALGEILKIHGTVLPVTTGQITLRARLENGQEIVGEKNIDIPDSPQRSRIKDVWLEPNAFALSETLRAIKETDILLISPGDLFTSIVPVFLVRGIKEALQEFRGKIIYICNTMTKPGETDGFNVSDFVKIIEAYSEKKIDTVICNNSIPSETVLARYALENSRPVAIDVGEYLNEIKIISANILADGELARHNPTKIAEVLKPLL